MDLKRLQFQTWKYLHKFSLGDTQACLACKSYYFGWVGWNGTLCEPNVFIFVTEKEAQNNFQTKKILHYFTLRERK